jgi:hypothetical protein
MATTLPKAAPHTAVAHGLASTGHPRVRKPSKAPPPPTLPQIGPSNDMHALQPMAEELQVAFQKEIEAKEQVNIFIQSIIRRQLTTSNSSMRKFMKETSKSWD